MKDWSRSDLIALISLLVAIVACFAAIFVPELRRLIGLDNRAKEKDIVISTPNNRSELARLSGESRTIKRPIVGEVCGYTEQEIERLGLYVEVLIKTDRWYSQGTTGVHSKRKWELKEASFGGVKHIIRATLKDKHEHEHKSTEIEVTVVS